MRDSHDDDLDQAIQIWDQSRHTGEPLPVFPISEVIVDLPQLVQASEMFTPADIEFAARKGAQSASEREIAHRRGEPATTLDYLAAVAETRPTLTDQAVAEFRQDIERYTRW